MDTKQDLQRVHPSVQNGLSQQQVDERIAKGLTNTAQEKITKTTGEIIRDNVFTLFNAFNFIIAICLALVGAYTNMVFVLIVATNVMIGIVQEIHAKKMVENLSLLGATKTKVVRDGKTQEISVEDLVLDDIALLRLGDQICADGVVVQGEIEVNEALLTGEADPIFKRPGDNLLSGSFVVSGNAYLQVEHVGADNFVAKLAAGAKKHKKTNSELLNSMRKVTKFTSYFIVPIGILLFIEAYFMRGDSMFDSVVSSSAGLLGMLPKGLLLLISTSLVLGIVKMSKKRVLVQDLYALETLAHVDMLCLDKTGTITEGKMCVSNLYIKNESLLPIPVDKAISCFVGALEDNNATFVALREYFSEDRSFAPTHITPFSSERKWSSATFENLGTLVIGAPEMVLKGQASMLPAEAVKAQNAGRRILCLAHTNKQIENNKLPEVDLIAVIELDDPIRKNAKETLAFFRREGVDIKIISGDNPVTVSGIAMKAGLEDYDSYIDMSTLHSESEVAAAALKYSVFGRVTPQQKSQLVKALQANGHTVGMTGDGVNDVLALKEADCSIAVASGSDAAQQVSKFVLLDSDFTAIPDMVMEGRRVVNNITRFGGVFFIKTIYSVLLSIFSILTLTAFPFVPIQITLYDFAIEAYPSFLLALAPDGTRIRGKFLPNVISKALPYSVLIIINILLTLIISPLIGISEPQATTVMYFITSFAGLVAVFNACRPLDLPRAFVSVTAFGGFYLATFLFSKMLYVAPLSLPAVLLFAGLAIVCPVIKFLLTKLIDMIFNRLRSDRKVLLSEK
ncbi:cation-translocating P-type ATPase [Anaerosporobacter sp.]|uniref:cation-translocating P-type ATPase n=1 Tax=Anaerosporobacter sp. TaxID=1872529 RepID=UPI00286F0B6F|nr:cation-translocating P-type ATPase [Anaerosporobacter sp.]